MKAYQDHPESGSAMTGYVVFLIAALLTILSASGCAVMAGAAAGGAAGYVAGHEAGEDEVREEHGIEDDD